MNIYNLESKKTGEIISSNTNSFIAQCIKDKNKDELTLPQAPYFGSFVKAKGEELGFDIIAIVYEISSGSIDSIHRPTAMNLSREELRLNQPQIFDLLKTDFSAIIIGYIVNDKIFQSIPPHPPQIHDFVYTCDSKEITMITEKKDYLRTLLNSGINLSEELIQASIKYGYYSRGCNRDFLVETGRELSSLLKDNYDKLSSILKRINPSNF
ncbi:MAG: hypothetical protein U0457_20900 [Candidatus Sericytochromatia bacterium]